MHDRFAWLNRLYYKKQSKDRQDRGCPNTLPRPTGLAAGHLHPGGQSPASPSCPWPRPLSPDEKVGKEGGMTPTHVDRNTFLKRLRASGLLEPDEFRAALQ